MADFSVTEQSNILSHAIDLLGIPLQLVVFFLDNQRYALYLSAVDRVARIVDITPLAKAPQVVLGVINVQGQLIPVFNVRQRFRLPERELALTDQLIVARTEHRSVALVVDTVADVIECAQQQIIAAEQILPDTEYLEGIVKLDDGLILIHSLDKFLSLEEKASLTEALETS